jgi:Leucine-rich repeat (LRR) protein
MLYRTLTGLLILSIVGCSYKPKYGLGEKKPTKFDEHDKSSFIANCEAPPNEVLAHTFQILKTVTGVPDCAKTFSMLNNLASLDFGFPKPGEDSVVDLTPLESLPNLKHLAIQYRKLVDPKPLSGLTHLERLILVHTDFEHTEVLSSLTQLKYLDLSFNKIKNILPLIPLTQLEDLWLKKNLISDVEAVRHLTKLKYLDLADNEVADVTALSVLHSLRWLFIEGNPVVDISHLAHLPALEVVYFDRQKVTHPPASLVSKFLTI